MYRSHTSISASKDSVGQDAHPLGSGHPTSRSHFSRRGKQLGRTRASYGLSRRDPLVLLAPSFRTFIVVVVSRFRVSLNDAYAYVNNRSSSPEPSPWLKRAFQHPTAQCISLVGDEGRRIRRGLQSLTNPTALLSRLPTRRFDGRGSSGPDRLRPGRLTLALSVGSVERPATSTSKNTRDHSRRFLGGSP